jgi:hypothetical protein
VGKWRTLFEDNLPPHGEGEYVLAYEFGPPAAEAEVVTAERALSVRLPADLRELVSEFNGVWVRARTSPEPDNHYLSLELMAELAERQREAGWAEVFENGELDKIVFICGYNGWTQLWALCVEDVGEFPAGAVVYHDHDAAELEAGYASLADFVRDGPKL